MKLPDKIFGIETKGALERYLEESQKPKAQPPQSRTRTTSLEGINLADYIFLPQHDLYVAKQTSYQGSNWSQSHDALHQDRARMLTIKEFVDFLKMLKTGYAQDGLEQNILATEVHAIYNSITEKKNPYRTEWLDADFKVVNGVLHINYYHQDVNGQLQPQKSEPLERCVMEDRYVDLFSANRQGLPTQTSRGQDFHYSRPLENNNSVAGFWANSNGAGLGCIGHPRDSYSSLGVRAAREKK